MEQTQNPKCSECKCYWKPNETDTKPSGLYFKTCNKCRDRKMRYRLNNKDKIKQNYIENFDKIKEYKKQHYLENIDKIKEYQNQYYIENADKLKEYGKQYYLENIDKHKEQSRQYYLENIDKIKEYNKQYNIENVDKIKEYYKQYYSNIKENNPIRYLAVIQRTQLSKCLKYFNENKKEYSIEYLGCSYEDFHKHIETKINNWNTDNPNNLMDFTNIHIDHIKPISRFNFTDEGEELLDCCNYTNLQPLLIFDNLSKNNKWTDENELYWNENIKGNSEYNKVYL
jgi:hypothetical protein